MTLAGDIFRLHQAYFGGTPSVTTIDVLNTSCQAIVGTPTLSTGSRVAMGNSYWSNVCAGPTVLLSTFTSGVGGYGGGFMVGDNLVAVSRELAFRQLLDALIASAGGNVAPASTALAGQFGLFSPYAQAITPLPYGVSQVGAVNIGDLVQFASHPNVSYVVTGVSPTLLTLATWYSGPSTAVPTTAVSVPRLPTLPALIGFSWPLTVGLHA